MVSALHRDPLTEKAVLPILPCKPGSLPRHGLDDCLAADPPVNLIQPARLDLSV